jgi:excisionase family DNA binding protein
MTRTKTTGKRAENGDATGPPTHQEDPIISVNEAARRVGKHHNTVQNWIRSGLLRAVRTQDRILGVRESALNKLLESSEMDWPPQE